jgi:hypothetical protein
MAITNVVNHHRVFGQLIYSIDQVLDQFGIPTKRLIMSQCDDGPCLYRFRLEGEVHFVEVESILAYGEAIGDLVIFLYESDDHYRNVFNTLHGQNVKDVERILPTQTRIMSVLDFCIGSLLIRLTAEFIVEFCLKGKNEIDKFQQHISMLRSIKQG